MIEVILITILKVVFVAVGVLSMFMLLYHVLGKHLVGRYNLRERLKEEVEELRNKDI